MVLLPSSPGFIGWFRRVYHLFTDFYKEITKLSDYLKWWYRLSTIIVQLSQLPISTVNLNNECFKLISFKRPISFFLYCARYFKTIWIGKRKNECSLVLSKAKATSPGDWTCDPTNNIGWILYHCATLPSMNWWEFPIITFKHNF